MAGLAVHQVTGVACPREEVLRSFISAPSHSISHKHLDVACAISHTTEGTVGVETLSFNFMVFSGTRQATPAPKEMSEWQSVSACLMLSVFIGFH